MEGSRGKAKGGCGEIGMVIDFHSHFVPRQLVADDAPARHAHWRIFGEPMFDMEKRLALMDDAGVDVSVLSSGAGTEGNLDDCRLVNDSIKALCERYPDRFLGMAHVPPLSGAAGMAELKRAREELGFRCVTISILNDSETVDSPRMWPFYGEVKELGLLLHLHPALHCLGSAHMQDYDLERSIGREFDTIMAVVRLINCGALDDFPGLKVCVSHLAGGIVSLLPRIRGFQDKVKWKTAGHPRHGRVPKRDFDAYLREMYFDTSGFFGAAGAIRCALVEFSPEQLLFGTDTPIEIRQAGEIRQAVGDLQQCGLAPQSVADILGGNVRNLLGVANA